MFFIYLDDFGNFSMVDVGEKKIIWCIVWVQVIVVFGDIIMDMLEGDEIQIKKGFVF